MARHRSSGHATGVQQRASALASLLELQVSPMTGRSRWQFSSSDAPASAEPGRGCLKKFCVCESPGKGLGCFTTRAIIAGEMILAESPIFSASGQDLEPSSCKLEEIVAALSDAERRDYYCLCGREGEAKDAQEIWRSNAYPTPCDGDSRRASIFRLCSRFNHACCPNAHIAWNARIRKQTVTHAAIAPRDRT